MPRAREWRAVDRADVAVVHRTAAWLRDDPGRARRAGVACDEDVLALAVLLDLLATEVPHLDAAVRREVVEACRQALGWHPDIDPTVAERQLGAVTDTELDALRRRAEQGDTDAADELIELAGERGDMDELRRLADGGNATAADQLIELATERGDVDELQRLADGGNATAAAELEELRSE